MSLRSFFHGCLYGFLLMLAVNGTAALARSPKAAVPEYCPEDPMLILTPSQYLRVKQSLLREGGDPNQCFAETSILVWAIAMDDQQMVRWLLDAGAHPDRPRSPGSTLTPLMLTFSGRNYDIALLLLSRGADPRVINKTDGQTLLHELAFGPRAIADRPEELEIAQIARKAGISVNARNAIGMTPLYLAVGMADHQLISWLLQHGADWTLKDHKNRDALTRARVRRDGTPKNDEDFPARELTALLLETEPLARLLRQGKTAEFERTFKNCIPEKTVRHATVLLMTAVEYGHREAARTLIRCGGKADETGFVLHRLAEKDRFGEPKLVAARMTPLALAALKGDEAMAAALKRAQ